MNNICAALHVDPLSCWLRARRAPPLLPGSNNTVSPAVLQAAHPTPLQQHTSKIT